MAWLREIRLESVDIIVKSDNEPALTSFDCVMEHDEGISSWQFEEQWNCREGDPVGAGDVRTIRSDIEGRWRVKINATHPILAVDRRTRGILVDEVRGRPRWEDRVRETEGQISKSARHGIC